MNVPEFRLGQLLSLYEGMDERGVSQADRLRQAEDLSQNPSVVARMFDDDVKTFAANPSVDEAFHSEAEDRNRASFAPRSKTRVVAQSLMTLAGDREIEVADRPELSFHYVDREIVTARARGAAFRTFDGRALSSRSLPRLDLLLANARDKTPIVAELKVDDDRDPFYALIQALAHATMLVNSNQLKRLRSRYEGRFAEDCQKVDVYVVLAGVARGSNWQAFHEYATRLAQGLLRCEPFTRWVRRLEKLTLRVEAR